MYQFQEVLKSTDKCWKVLGCRQGASTLTSKRGGPCRVEQSNSVGKHTVMMMVIKMMMTMTKVMIIEI